MPRGEIAVSPVSRRQRRRVSCVSAKAPCGWSCFLHGHVSLASRVVSGRSGPSQYTSDLCGIAWMMARRIPTSMNPHVLKGSVSWLQSSGACEIAVAFGASLLRGEIAVVLVSRRKRRVGLLSPASGGFVVDSRKQVIRVGVFLRVPWSCCLSLSCVWLKLPASRASPPVPIDHHARQLHLP